MLTGKLYELELITVVQASEWVGLSKEIFLKMVSDWESEKAFSKDWFRMVSQEVEQRFGEEPDYRDVPLKGKNPDFIHPNNL